MSLAYKVEELLALRDSVSESAVSIDRFADEDVIKEHVLRPSASASANLASRASSRSLQPSTAPQIAPLASAAVHKRPSPSPSIKRGKAEKLLKEHGSPPGMRVTAGGRVIPSDLPPLGSSAYNESAYKPHSLRVTSANTMPPQVASNSSGTARIELVGGHPVVFIGDRMFALPIVSSSTPVPALGAGASMNPLVKQSIEPTALNPHVDTTGLSFGPQRAQSQSPLAALDLGTLKAQQALKKQELRSVEQTEVLQANQQTEAWRIGVIEKKRNLIVELDTLRKQIASLESDSVSLNQANSFFGPIGTAPGSVPPPTFMPQPQQPFNPAMYAFPASNPYASMMMYPPSPYGAFPGFSVVEPTPFTATSSKPPHSPGSAGRRSHAIEIKPPQEDNKKQQSSVLDPKSPTYEPSNNTSFKRNVVHSSLASSKRSPWTARTEAQADRSGPRAPSHKPSLSSVDTTDFFPTNTHEYSTTRLGPQANEPKLNENKAAPSTPEKHWPASPWNEATSGSSRKNDAEPKLTSFPEAFGKQQSTSSLRTSGANQPSAAMQECAPVLGTYLQKHSSSSELRVARGLDRRMEGENRPFSRKEVAPSTWQEGWQAGYDHVGMPDNEAVLEGYAQGILRFLSDGPKKTQMEAPLRNAYGPGMESHSSLRGLVAGSTPHDSAVSMTLDRNDDVLRKHENGQTSKNMVMADSHRRSAYSPHASIKEFPLSQAPVDAAAYTSRPRNVSNMQRSHSAAMPPDRYPSGRQGGVFNNGENEGKAYMDQGSTNRVDPYFSIGGFRQFSGSQGQGQNYGLSTPLYMQRFYATPKEIKASNGYGSNASTSRGYAEQRLSGLDGAMDDLAEMVADSHVDEGRASYGAGIAKHEQAAEGEEVDASCFGPSSGKGKQKAAPSPKKMPGEGRSSFCSSPGTVPSSPRKSGEHSPAKVKIEQVTNKFRRMKRDDPRTISPEERAKRSDRWRQRFQHLKRLEVEEAGENDKKATS